jgi:hypothetical protein
MGNSATGQVGRGKMRKSQRGYYNKKGANMFYAKNIKCAIVFLLLLAAILTLWSCESSTTDADDNLHLMLSESGVDVYLLKDSIPNGHYTQFLLAAGDIETYFDGYALYRNNPGDCKMTFVDLSGDSIADIAVFFLADTGTSAHTENAHVFDGTTFEHYEVISALDIAHENLALSADDDFYYIDTGKDRVAVSKSAIISRGRYVTDITELFPLPFFELVYSYKIQDGRLCASLPIQVGITQFCGEIEITYKLDSKCFVLDDIGIVLKSEFI